MLYRARMSAVVEHGHAVADDGAGRVTSAVGVSRCIRADRVRSNNAAESRMGIVGGTIAGAVVVVPAVALWRARPVFQGDA